VRRVAARLTTFLAGFDEEPDLRDFSRVLFGGVVKTLATIEQNLASTSGVESESFSIGLRLVMTLPRLFASR
jgi:hypothetical protein